ncbi:hypothetical protein MNBD_GAMMA09-1493 [hydrothermal vent metagenome]|uniref:Uncharacterized protein n=1 Tax=hydrothermal vent metagenome TaxID=652676 RepID=A0A3B0XFJ9_9ZZZZ
MPKPRSAQVSLEATPFYHCTSYLAWVSQYAIGPEYALTVIILNN